MRGVAVPILEIVPTTAHPPPPYPADTRAGNYGLRLDMARVHQSTTYLLACRPECPPELRAWLIFLWCESWQQIPMATLPDSDELVAAILGMPNGYFAVHKQTLMRGWKRHSDGRLYHDFLTGLVLATLRERARYKRHRDHETVEQAALQVVENVERNVAPPLPLRAEVEVKVKTEATTKPKTTSTPPLLKGSRMDPEAQCPDEWRDWLVDAYGVTPNRAVGVFVMFRDYWSDVPGRHGLKVRWFATFKNRARALAAEGKL